MEDDGNLPHRLLQVSAKHIRPLIATNTLRSCYQASLLPGDPEAEGRGTIHAHFLVIYYRSRICAGSNTDRYYEIKDEAMEKIDRLEKVVAEVNSRNLMKYLCDQTHCTTLEIGEHSIGALELCLKNQNDRKQWGPIKLWNETYTKMEVSGIYIENRTVADLESMLLCEQCNRSPDNARDGYNFDHITHMCDLVCMHRN